VNKIANGVLREVNADFINDFFTFKESYCFTGHA